MGAREHPGLRVVRVFCGADGSHGNPLGVFLDGRAIEEAERQPIATELGFSETVFLDDAERGEMRIFTPADELALAGHPLVGTAWLLRERGSPPEVLRPPAGEVKVRFDGDSPYVAARPEWCPPFEWVQLDSPAEVEALAGPPEGYGLVGMWAWIDQDAGLIRARVFVPAEGIPEDQATGSAAIILCSQLGRLIEIRQGRGSVLQVRPLDGGYAEVGGIVVDDPDARPD
jgi:predicted PhzF superfamily epimerase YddE/YHI9